MRNMLKEDNILNSRFGKKNHFQVPAGYFDQLTDRVMVNLPEQDPRIIHMQPSLWHHSQNSNSRRNLSNRHTLP